MTPAYVIRLDDHRPARPARPARLRAGVTNPTPDRHPRHPSEGRDEGREHRRTAPAVRTTPPVIWDRRLGRVVDAAALGAGLALLCLRIVQIAAWAFVGGLTAFVFIVGLFDPTGGL